MTDDREYIQRPNFFWAPNPGYTGNKFAEVFKSYPVRLLKEFENGRKFKKGENVWVQRLPSNRLYLFETETSIAVILMNAVEGVDFEVIT